VMLYVHFVEYKKQCVCPHKSWKVVKSLWKWCFQLLLEICDVLSSSGGGWQLIPPDTEGTERVKALESDLFPCCEGTTRCCSFSQLHAFTV